MDRHTLYNQKSRWLYPQALIDLILHDIKNFYIEHNKANKANSIKRFKNQPAFLPLRNYIILKCKRYDKDIPDLRWLVDFYNKRKNGKQLTKSYFEALLKSFNYYYNPDNDSYSKRIPKQIDNTDFVIERNQTLKLIISKSKSNNDSLRDFVGIYKYFVGGRKEETRYDYIYENEIEIYYNGEFQVRNPFNGHVYIGLAVLKTNSCLQLISYDFDGPLIDGIGNLLTFKISKYGRLNKLIPGLSSSFDSDGRVIFAQALLCTELQLTKKSKIIREYFDKIVTKLRLYSPEIIAVDRLVNKYYKE